MTTDGHGRIRVAIIGGGPGSLIGPAHQTAIRFDDRYELVAGVVSANAEQALACGERMGLARPYRTAVELLDSERGRGDGAQVIAIMTPNDSHHALCAAALEAGFHVICDKPLANTLRDALDIVERCKASGRLLCVTYNYSGYPMVRQARAMIAEGRIGRPHLVDVKYAQGNLGTRLEEAPESLTLQLRWRLDPARGGAAHLLLDVGVHAHHLAEYVTGLRFTRVFADTGAAVKGRQFADSAVVVGRLDGDVRATIQATKAASGAPNIFSIAVYGDRGGVSWEQAQPNVLQFVQQDRPVQIYHRGVGELSALALHSIRTPMPHPEGFRDAFANIYSDFASAVAARNGGVEPDPLVMTYPTALEGARGLAFVEACVQSSQEGRWIDMPPLRSAA
jgi:predicted dehydrogenase